MKQLQVKGCAKTLTLSVHQLKTKCGANTLTLSMYKDSLDHCVIVESDGDIALNRKQVQRLLDWLEGAKRELNKS